jgi:hypothetical protein
MPYHMYASILGEFALKRQATPSLCPKRQAIATLPLTIDQHFIAYSSFIQLGEFTLKRHAMATLPRYIEHHPDFVSVFGGAVNSHTVATIGAAEVKYSEHRQWLRLVGRRHDVQVSDVLTTL